jgi:lipopolysaccharide export system protein LptA
MKRSHFLLILFFILGSTTVHAQQPVTDSMQIVEILKANTLRWIKVGANTELQILAGDVQLRQDNTLFYCDSCIINRAANTFEAFGKVHINDHDTVNIYSDYLRYLTNTKMAYLNGNVKLDDGKATLTTTDLEYDVNNKIGTYRNGGKVVNKKSVLTSQEGVYYTETKDIIFKRNVDLKDPAYILKSDSLQYNTQTQVATFIAETYIRDSSKRVITTREGFYDAANSHAEFSSRTCIQDGAMTACGDRIASDDKLGITQLEGRAFIKDTSKGTDILADKIFIDKKTDAILATRKPLMIIKQDNDSIYVTADTLFSARLTTLYKNDTAKLKRLALKEKDSTNRYFEAFRHVRVFTDSLQSVCDSLFYSFKDSTFHLFYDPIVWSNKSQITGDTIYLFTKNKKADRFKVIDNSFIVNEVEKGVYNQIRSSRMDGFFKQGQIDSVRSKGFAESVYFLQDKDSAFTGSNKTNSDAIDIYFQKGELYKVVFRSELTGTLYPISQKQPSEMKLEKFRWLEDRRPKTKYELFE